MRTHVILFMLALNLTNVCYAQYGSAYQQLHIRQPEYETNNSKDGVVIFSITPSEDGYEVCFGNTNHSDYAIITNVFDWYLSYKGKRVSDYFTTSVTNTKKVTKKVFAWPGSVPAGYEKYVSAQLGKEPQKRDRRDDD